MLVAWRDDGFWTLLFLAGWLILTGGRKRDLPPPGFAGQISGSLAVIEPRHFKRRLMTLYRTHSTPPAPAWQLTCVWERSRLLSRGLRLGPSSVGAGALPPAVDGEDSLGTRRVSSSTTLISASLSETEPLPPSRARLRFAARQDPNQCSLPGLEDARRRLS